MGLAMAVESFDWIVLNDTVMGGRSSATVSTVENSIQFQGIVSLENNGGFASIRTRDTIDLSTHTSVEIELVGTDTLCSLLFGLGRGKFVLCYSYSAKYLCATWWIFLSLWRSPMVVRCLPGP